MVASGSAPSRSARIACIGKFDALHRGHAALAAAACELGDPTIITFHGMADVLGWEPRLPLVAPRDRQRVIDTWAESFGRPIATLQLPFAELREYQPEQVIAYLVEELGFDGLVCGEDFRFGRDRAGSVADLRRAEERRGLALAVVPPVMHEHAAVSSSRVRSAIAAGRVHEAWALLDRPHRLCGSVVSGAGRGRQLGWPTANLGALENLPPSAGVYAAWARLEGESERIPAAVNIGRAPTLSTGEDQTVEAHLIDWSGDAVGLDLALDFTARLRDEQRFDSVVALRDQIASDVGEVRRELLGR